MWHNKIVSAILLWCASFACVNVAQAQTASHSTPLGRVVAVVNDDVITSSELDARLSGVKQQLQKQNIPLPPAGQLEKQVLDRMVMDMLLTQFAKDTGVRVDDAQLDKTLQRIAQNNKFASLDEFKAKLVADGVDYAKFREEVRGQIVASRVREREVDSKLVISDGEVDNYLANEAKQPSEEFQLAHIFVMVPEQASADKIQASRQKADQALAQIQGGADFAQVAAGFSDANDAMQGGDLGWRAADRIPTLFLDAVRGLKPGQVSPVLRSPNGFHILKLVAKRDKDSPVIVTQTHVSHILIKTSESVSESEAKSRLEEVKKRLDGGADFAEQARKYSEDGSAASGGDLGWISPGDTVPEFEAAMNALQPGQTSGLVQTSFGWHLIHVIERRSADVSEDQRKQQARLALHSLKSDEAFQDWLRQLRDRAYVEYRQQN
ncbi:MAG: peptidylprolyl isomerase [Gallionellaceae bacterium]|jgi:peptidyl-prolyl cis-trans isomerase SurA|nr:peptidylprolyl isomerase [Gallionellaceae bacterium]